MKGMCRAEHSACVYGKHSGEFVLENLLPRVLVCGLMHSGRHCHCTCNTVFQ